MLWIGGQVSPASIIKAVFLPSLANLVIPLFVVSFTVKGREIVAPHILEEGVERTNSFERNLVFYLGLALLMAPCIQDCHAPAAVHGDSFRARHSLAGG